MPVHPPPTPTASTASTGAPGSAAAPDPARTPQERSQLAAALHDGLAQELAFLGYQIDRLITVLARPAAGAAAEGPTGEGLASAQDLRLHVTSFLADLRASITELRAPVATGSAPTDTAPTDTAPTATGLAGAVGAYARSAGGAAGTPGGQPAITVLLQLPPGQGPLAPDTERAVLRLAQTAIDRACARPAARTLWVTLVTDPAGLRLLVQDDGRDAPAAEEAAWRTALTQRADQLGALLRLTPRQPTGSQVRLTLPGAA